jgi:5-methylcytosine-specific restriction endonuclease McrBC GTP-binding regulatory subunit McrB
MYGFLAGEDTDAPLLGVGLWDLFCGHVKENTTKNTNKSTTKNTNKNVANQENITVKLKGINKVFYGTPGCGKSYYLENTELTGVNKDFVFRTTFFQDYSNTDFVGQILPRVEGEKVTYEFVPGSFSLALKCAIDHPKEKVALVIEELNRGNAPSILGDIFQLLDRKDGESIYPIVNVNVQSYLKKKSGYDLGYIKIPANLYIYATMNTSDQNVFTLDTAFKRRWKFEKLTNDFSATDTIGNKFVPGFKCVTWQKFVETINKFIINHATSLSAEDKQIGKYFIDEELLMGDKEGYLDEELFMDNIDDYSDDDLENEREKRRTEKYKDFAHKIFEYLWADVAKFNRTDWFDSEVKSLDTLLYKFKNHEKFFASPLDAELPIYEEGKE